jgi:hypothetical protein
MLRDEEELLCTWFGNICIDDSSAARIIMGPEAEYKVAAVACEQTAESVRERGRRRGERAQRAGCLGRKTNACSLELVELLCLAAWMRLLRSTEGRL